MSDLNDLSDKDILARTVYLEARGEPKDGWRGVAFVILRRAKLNKSYWGGNSVKKVCLKAGQFECYKQGLDHSIRNISLYNEIKLVTDKIFDGDDTTDPTRGADHYNNPTKENPPPDWTYNCNKTVMIGKHQFYKSKDL